MGTPISTVDWVEKNEVVDELLIQENTLTILPMDQGMEAEVMKISSDKESFVLKVWNKSSKPDVSFQYDLLNVLSELGFPVSKPLGWGINLNGDKLLLTSYDGTPVFNVNEKKLTEIANILSSIHQIHVNEIGNIQLPKYDFINYFFPRVKVYSDIYNALISLVQLVQVKQENIIHGDFHVLNILEENDRYTVIDWTNVQLGDPRYDFAWSHTLKKIYGSERYANVFRSAYLRDNDIRQQELDVFEALACLRWIVLDRTGGVPKGSTTLERIKGLLTNNPFLKEFEITI